jgi:hypothetical protein
MNMGGRVKNSPFILKDVEIIQKKGKSVTNKKIPINKNATKVLIFFFLAFNVFMVFPLF